MLGIIVLVILAVIFIGWLIEKLGDAAQYLLGVVAVIAGIVGAFFLLKFLFSNVPKWLHMFFTVIPMWLIIIYSVLFLSFVVIWFINCILNVNIQFIFERELKTIPMAGYDTEILEQIRHNVEEHAEGITRFMARIRLHNTQMCKSLIYLNSVELSEGLCCNIAVLAEFLYIVNNRCAGTDVEFMETVEEHQAELSAEVWEKITNIKNIQILLKTLVKRRNLEKIELPNMGGNEEGDTPFDDFDEKILYIAKSPEDPPQFGEFESENLGEIE